MSDKKKIYFIIGPTASGKTSLSIELAKRIRNAEIISADSRQIYKDFNLTSGKVTIEEMQNIPHHLLDVVNPGEYFSVVDFENLALQKIQEIYERGNTPIVCGGTGFYIDSLLYKITLPDVKKNDELRKFLDKQDTLALFNVLKQKLFAFKNLRFFFKNLKTLNKFSKTEYRNNPHRLERAIEIVESLGYIPELKREKRFDSKKYNVEIIQTNISRNILREKIYKRILERLEQGMLEEVENVKDKYNLSFEYLEGLGLEFKWISKFIKKEISKQEMIENLYTEICQYAKRQETWFKRYKNYL